MQNLVPPGHMKRKNRQILRIERISRAREPLPKTVSIRRRSPIHALVILQKPFLMLHEKRLRANSSRRNRRVRVRVSLVVCSVNFKRIWLLVGDESSFTWTKLFSLYKISLRLMRDSLWMVEKLLRMVDFWRLGISRRSKAALNRTFLGFCLDLADLFKVESGFSLSLFFSFDFLCWFVSKKLEKD